MLSIGRGGTYSTIVPPGMGPVAYMNIAIGGMVAFAALHYFLMWWWSRRERVLLIDSLFSVVIGFSTASIIGVMTADSVTAAQRALDMRTTFTILAFPLLVAIVSDIAAVRPGRVLTFVTVACVLVSVLSALGVPINGTVTVIDQTRFPWGEILTVVDRRGALWAAPVYGVVMFVEAFVLFLGWRATRRDRLVGTVIMLTGVVAVLATIVPFLADVVQKAVDLFGYPPEELVMKSARYSTGTGTNISAV